MKHATIRSLAHNFAASLASGLGFVVGHYPVDIFRKAEKTDEGVIVDFLNGKILSGDSSFQLRRGMQLYRDALPGFCAKHGVSIAAISEFTARYYKQHLEERFTVTVADRSGHRTVTDYVGFDGHRLKTLDGLKRIRRTPVRRTDRSS